MVEGEQIPPLSSAEPPEPFWTGLYAFGQKHFKTIRLVVGKVLEWKMQIIVNTNQEGL